MRWNSYYANDQIFDRRDGDSEAGVLLKSCIVSEILILFL